MFGFAVGFFSKQFRDRALSTRFAHRLLQWPRIDAFYFGAGLPAEEIKMFLFFFFFCLVVPFYFCHSFKAEPSEYHTALQKDKLSLLHLIFL